ncbi:MotA/TolQ/ExbB proton channel family protein [Simiduia curdlanivorans]|uniref:MotA/TolQ/ExbB proton channel family protein n=1 Tax=Simiduia curdlanivorans TaxID=1492769 RepID=A0ABV8V1V1_9GAMM|nr:MotA/TolQ/ExbB proton channel family protein [Simiduia curdlanivorans]MDN3637478.1 MotA/TolQ/ExbB proton channel family protein [Simiduia curdlanivorans]
MIDQLLQSRLCWVIVLLALVCYYQLWLAFLQRRGTAALSRESDQPSIQTLEHEFSAVLVNALPLLGLLGTIMGLLSCFAGIASDGASSEMVSGGIAEALLTTQLGLVCAVPGWLLLAYVRASYDERRQLAEAL